ncbi:CLUMA_CG001299, isoform A [Clunio marinus]|uniref:CLUMA_CG001299, isoform A n=1 Tax=Clunio marinus TaxID=568069 RepID=A0A1J1HIW4_9DIPT|nr:CLUMA_CG001299, isoform A [Clunio marinus]
MGIVEKEAQSFTEIRTKSSRTRRIYCDLSQSHINHHLLDDIFCGLSSAFALRKRYASLILPGKCHHP